MDCLIKIAVIQPIITNDYGVNLVIDAIVVCYVLINIKFKFRVYVS
jgi:hypothetical protein